MILVIDLEATCCDQGTITPEQMEVIELGAVWATPAGEVTRYALTSCERSRLGWWPARR